MNTTTNNETVVRAWTASTSAGLSPSAVLESVVAITGVQSEDINGERRWKSVVRARHLYWALLRRQCHLSYPQIGLLTGRNHSTVMMAIKKVPTEVLDAMEGIATERNSTETSHVAFTTVEAPIEEPIHEVASA